MNFISRLHIATGAVFTPKGLHSKAQGRRFGAPWVGEGAKQPTPKGLDNQGFCCATPSG
jgi:hypothetical protein